MRDQVKTESVLVHLLLRGRDGRMCDEDRGEQALTFSFTPELVKANSFGISLYGVPDYVGFYPFVLSSAVLRNSPDYFPFGHSRVAQPSINQTFTPDWYRNRSQPSALPNHIDDNPVVLPRLQLIQSQVHGFGARRKPIRGSEQYQLMNF
jgi:hypothetical protein